MKKIFFSIFLTASMLTSCDMNELPAGTLNDETAIQTEKDAMKFRNGLYNSIRSLTGGNSVSYPDIQADLFIGTVVNGNRIGPISAGNILSSDKELESFWASPYGAIADANYFLPQIEKVLATPGLSQADQISLKRYRGETYWARAFFYYYLTERYCNSYVVSDPTAANSGVPLVTEFAPTGDYSKYKGRASLAEVYAQIESDLAQAEKDLKEFEESGAADAKSNLAPNAAYLSTFTVYALEARIALLKGEYSKAIEKAEKVLAGPFELSDPDEYMNMWVTDSGSELIFVPYGDLNQNGAVPATGTAWLSNTPGTRDYVLSSSALALYDNFDIRYIAFVEPGEINADEGTVYAPVFIKYPGNPVFNTGSSNAFRNKPKPFRLSEIYLIIAEAGSLGTDAEKTKANNALNTLRKARIEGYEDQTYMGPALVNEVRNERAKELIGEGFRISDLRRWGLGFTRNVNYMGEFTDTPLILTLASAQTIYQPGDYRYVLPIPTNEMDTNPQLAGYQNPGY